MTLPLDDTHLRFQYRLARHYLHACRRELEVHKPGNVSLHGAAYGMSAEDFENSAEASTGALTHPDLRLGERIFHAVTATREAVGCNTNLGIILLSAPLMHSVIHRKKYGQTDLSLRASLHRTLSETDVRDAIWSYRAIRLASPGGLGRAQEHDIYEQPLVCLQEAMRCASPHDRIAYQYVTDYEDVFAFMLPGLRESRGRYDDDRQAILEVYLRMLARVPDTHVARKYGHGAAREVSSLAAELEAELERTGHSDEFRLKLKLADEKLKKAGLNPGTTADLTVATLLIDRLESDWGL